MKLLHPSVIISVSCEESEDKNRLLTISSFHKEIEQRNLLVYVNNQRQTNHCFELVDFSPWRLKQHRRHETLFHFVGLSGCS